MNLKTITLIAAITQLLAFFVSVSWFVKYVTDEPLHNNLRYLITQPVYLISEIMLIVFLFVLYSRQKG